jgi:quinol---cytochrome-c reductase cytochrome b subunit
VKPVARIADWFDRRVGAAKFAKKALDKVFPDHWSFMLGEIAMYSFVVLVLTGLYLTFFFVPDARQVVYHGSYAPLRGLTMSEAYRSTLDLSFDVRAGLVMRQTHHWAALVFVGAIVAHLMRIFFTGAFRRPREINWIIGLLLLLLALGNGFTGYSLPDDLLSGTGLRIAYSIVLSIPVVGEWLASLAFGGEFPTKEIISRLFVVHVLVIPVAIATLLTVHLAILVRQKHTQFRGPGRTEHNVVGSKLWPTFAAKTVGLFFAVFAMLTALGGLAQINPIWIYGPFDPNAVSSGSQPDWYIGWLEGALRLFPPWEIRAFGYEIPNPFFPGVLLPGIIFGLLFAWPFLEARFSRDHDEHNLLDRPRDRPLRTAIGVATLTFVLILFFAGGDDVIAARFDLSLNDVVWTFRVLVIVVPPLVALITYRLCRELQARDRQGPEPPFVEVDRDESGGYVTVTSDPD